MLIKAKTCKNIASFQLLSSVIFPNIDKELQTILFFKNNL